MLLAALATCLRIAGLNFASDLGETAGSLVTTSFDLCFVAFGKAGCLSCAVPGTLASSDSTFVISLIESLRIMNCLSDGSAASLLFFEPTEELR
jgi:hypothetical protein